MRPAPRTPSAVYHRPEFPWQVPSREGEAAANATCGNIEELDSLAFLLATWRLQIRMVHPYGLSRAARGKERESRTLVFFSQAWEGEGGPNTPRSSRRESSVSFSSLNSPAHSQGTLMSSVMCFRYWDEQQGSAAKYNGVEKFQICCGMESSQENNPGVGC